LQFNYSNPVNVSKEEIEGDKFGQEQSFWFDPGEILHATC
jgi:hypothetical protein